tara:strand:- start:160 stop:426 length:267 start_codon:yes stop_codon:yes gene_type:complete
MEQYATLEEVPSYFKMINKVETSGKPKQDPSCQPSFTYFNDGGSRQVQWGSDRPLQEVCPTNYKPHMGTPNHAIWNNLTKRKSIVMSN